MLITITRISLARSRIVFAIRRRNGGLASIVGTLGRWRRWSIWCRNLSPLGRICLRGRKFAWLVVGCTPLLLVRCTALTRVGHSLGGSTSGNESGGNVGTSSDTLVSQLKKSPTLKVPWFPLPRQSHQNISASRNRAKPWIDLK